MKSRIKKKIRYSVNISLMIAVLVLMSVSTGQALVSANRTIENNMLAAGNWTNITVTVQNDNVQRSLSLQESIPPGWNLMRISDGADTFKASTNEWVWLTVNNNTVKTVIYRITIPSGTIPGTYNISGSVNASNMAINVEGDNTIEVIGNILTNDTIAPTTTISGVTEGGSFDKNVTVTLSATDNPGGSGVNKTIYIVNGGNNTTYTSPFLVNKVGPNNIKFWSIDNKNNIESMKSINFTINETIKSFIISNPGNITITDSDVGNSIIVNNLPQDAKIQFVLNNGVPIFSKVESDGTTKYLLQATGNLSISATSQSTDIKNLSLVLKIINVPTPTSPPSGGSRSSSGGTGTTPTPTATVKNTTVPTPNATATTAMTPTGTIKEVPIVTEETPLPTATKKSPGFESIIGIIGLLSMVYLLGRR